jgi:hypothetical protein
MSACVDDARFAQQAQAFLDVHRQRPVAGLIANLDVQVDHLDTACGPLPVTIHDGGGGQAWVCSPRTTYADCAAEEAVRYLPAALAPLAAPAIAPLGHVLDWSGLDRNVAINNWLLSTNVYPALGGHEPARLLAQAVQRWPRHSIWFRSLNPVHTPDWITALQAAGCRLVASRQVYLYQDLDSLPRRHQNLARDLRLLQRTPLHYCDDAGMGEADYARIAELYHMLYVGKYSRYNPVYSAGFLRAWHRAGLLHFHGYRDADGQLQTIVGLFGNGQVVTSPIVGYNTALPVGLGLYRLATACVYRHAAQRRLQINFSAGAAHFKRLRGGRAAIEYSAVYAGHLPGRTRRTLDLLSAATCKAAAPLLRRLKL